jgi:transposase
MKHIGLDVHSTETYASVRNSVGTIVCRTKFATTRGELEKFMGGIKGPKRVVLEESQMADWMTRALTPLTEEVIRCQPQHNRLISESENKCDPHDADTLSDLLYLNRLKKVHHPEAAYRSLREAVRGYWIGSRELTRAKNRLKAFFLFNGSHEVGERVYLVRSREANLKRVLQLGANVELARLLYRHMDHCRKIKADHIRLVRQLAKPFKSLVDLLMTIPGIGPISAYTLVAYLEDGRRIANKRQLWKYAGLSLRRHESNGFGIKGASYSGNRMIKRVLMSAAITVVSREEKNSLTELWERWIRQGADAKRARRNLARKIGVIVHCVLRSGKEYRNEPVAA